MAVSAKGYVRRVYPDKGGCYFRLSDTKNVPKDGYFRIKKNHPNYTSLYALLLLSTTKGYRLWARAKSNIVKTKHAEVSYLVVDQ